jgi:hypothetical protein
MFLWGAQLEQASTASDYTRNVGGLFPARFDYDPVTLAPRGILIEEQRTNLLLYSAQFDDGAWTKPLSTVSANSATSPDGAVNADKLIPNTGVSVELGNLAPYCLQTLSKAASAITYTLSVFAKIGEFNAIRLDARDGGNTNRVGVTFSLINGAIIDSATAAGTFTNASAVSRAVGNGWYLCALTFTTGTETTLRSFVNANNATTTTGNGTSGIFIWGAQLEAGAFATSYIPTVASQVTRTADQASIVAPMFAPWYNQSEGTFVFEAATLSGGNFYRALAVARVAGGLSDRIDIGIGTGQSGNAGRFRADVTVGGVVQANLGDVAAFAAETPYKGALAYKANDFASATSGANLFTDSTGTVPTVAVLDIGNRINTANNFLNGWARRITYYPVRLSDLQLQALTS